MIPLLFGGAIGLATWVVVSPFTLTGNPQAYLSIGAALGAAFAFWVARSVFVGVAR